MNAQQQTVSALTQSCRFKHTLHHKPQHIHLSPSLDHIWERHPRQSEQEKIAGGSTAFSFRAEMGAPLQYQFRKREQTYFNTATQIHSQTFKNILSNRLLRHNMNFSDLCFSQKFFKDCRGLFKKQVTLHSSKSSSCSKLYSCFRSNIFAFHWLLVLYNNLSYSWDK